MGELETLLARFSDVPGITAKIDACYLDIVVSGRVTITSFQDGAYAVSGNDNCTWGHPKWGEDDFTSSDLEAVVQFIRKELELA